MNRSRDIFLFLGEVYGQHVLNFLIFLYFTYILNPSAFGLYGTISGILLFSFAISDLTVNEVKSESYVQVSIPLIILKLLASYSIFEFLVAAKKIDYDFHFITLIVLLIMIIWSEVKVVLIKERKVKNILLISLGSNIISFLIVLLLKDVLVDFDLLITRLFLIHSISGLYAIFYFKGYSLELPASKDIIRSSYSTLGRLSTSVFPVAGSTIYFGYMDINNLAAYNRYEVLGFVGVSGITQLIYRFFSVEGTTSKKKNLLRHVDRGFYLLLAIIALFWRPVTRLILPDEYLMYESSGLLIYSWLPLYLFSHVQRWLNENSSFKRSIIEDFVIAAIWLITLVWSQSPEIASLVLWGSYFAHCIKERKDRLSYRTMIFIFACLVYLWSIIS